MNTDELLAAMRARLMVAERVYSENRRLLNPVEFDRGVIKGLLDAIDVLQSAIKNNATIEGCSTPNWNPKLRR